MHNCTLLKYSKLTKLFIRLSLCRPTATLLWSNKQSVLYIQCLWEYPFIADLLGERRVSWWGGIGRRCRGWCRASWSGPCRWSSPLSPISRGISPISCRQEYYWYYSHNRRGDGIGIQYIYDLVRPPAPLVQLQVGQLADQGRSSSLWPLWHCFLSTLTWRS